MSLVPENFLPPQISLIPGMLLEACLHPIAEILLAVAEVFSSSQPFKTAAEVWSTLQIEEWYKNHGSGHLTGVCDFRCLHLGAILPF